METSKVLRPGDKIPVFWGRYGRVQATVHRISKKGQVYAKRYRRSYRNFTHERQVYPFDEESGVILYDIEPHAVRTPVEPEAPR